MDNLENKGDENISINENYSIVEEKKSKKKCC